MPAHPLHATFLALTSLALGSAASAQGFETLRVASGLDRPVFLTAAPGDQSRAFIVEQHSGRILILRLPERTLETTAFLDIPGLSTGTEQGLLGLAFHPDYATNGFFYVYVGVIHSSTQRCLRACRAHPGANRRHDL